MPRTKSENKKILDKRKQEIVEQAIVIFVEQTIKNTTVDDITKSLKISHGLFYHYFKNKNDLLNYIVSIGRETIGINFKKIREEYVGKDFIEHFFDYYLSLVKNKSSMFLIILMQELAKQSENHPINDDLRFSKFYDTAFYKNIKLLSDEGKLIQGINQTLSILFLLIDGINYSSMEKNSKATPISVKTILKAIIKEEYLNV